MLERNKSSPGHPTASPLTVQGVWKRHITFRWQEWSGSNLGLIAQGRVETIAFGGLLLAAACSQVKRMLLCLIGMIGIKFFQQCKFQLIPLNRFSFAMQEALQGL